MPKVGSFYVGSLAHRAYMSLPATASELSSTLGRRISMVLKLLGYMQSRGLVRRTDKQGVRHGSAGRLPCIWERTANPPRKITAIKALDCLRDKGPQRTKVLAINIGVSDEMLRYPLQRLAKHGYAKRATCDCCGGLVWKFIKDAI